MPTSAAAPRTRRDRHDRPHRHESFAGRPDVMLLRSVLVYRRAWWEILSGLFEPLFYLVILGNGMGALLKEDSGPLGAGYAAFIAPGLLAASAMNGAVYDTTMGIFFKLRHARLYEALMATPLGLLDIALGEILWAALRGAAYGTVFIGVMAALGLVSSPWAIAVPAAAFVVALGFAALGLAATTCMRTWQDTQFVRLVTVPLLMFSTTFYPLSVYPGPVQAIVRATPLYQAIELMRGLVDGHVGPSLLGHLGYFAAVLALGLLVATRRLNRLLIH
ncbi:ABC transporter permease [Streptomyces varsoviensis]|uniref:ABC transporter permease n=1 Tax=Streptomyces varsoviensis TaxID=67373 RepID=UPI0033C336B5